jgi:hypothetical protein
VNVNVSVSVTSPEQAATTQIVGTVTRVFVLSTCVVMITSAWACSVPLALACWLDADE